MSEEVYMMLCDAGYNVRMWEALQQRASAWWVTALVMSAVLFLLAVAAVIRYDRKWACIFGCTHYMVLMTALVCHRDYTYLIRSWRQVRDLAAQGMLIESLEHRVATIQQHEPIVTDDALQDKCWGDEVQAHWGVRTAEEVKKLRAEGVKPQ